MPSRRCSTSRRTTPPGSRSGRFSTSALTTPEGTFVDDLLVYRFGPSHYLLVINAGNIDKDVAWIAARAKEAVPDIAVVNSSDRYALIALQGPKSEEILQTLTAIDLAAIKYLLVRAR